MIAATETLSNKTFNTQIAINGSASGTAIITAPNTAGTPTLTLPTTTGTLAILDDIGQGEMLVVMGVYGG